MGTKEQNSLKSIVNVRASIPEDSFTAPMLGTERSGSGVVINDKGLVLTIGYLITEADDVQIQTSDGRTIPGHALAYDQETGFGLVQGLGKLDLPPISFGSSSDTRPGDDVTLAGPGQAVEGKIVAKQEFAGYWEYLLDEAIFTAPAHQSWGGAGLIGKDGRLLGVGSLMLQAAGPGGIQDINMVVPIDLLPPILDDLMSRGRATRKSRPWLGIYSGEQDGRVTVVNVDPRGPAADAGMESGDVILDVRNEAVESLADFYRKVWACGPAGTEILLRVARGGRDMWVRVKSANRDDFLRKPLLQ